MIEATGCANTAEGEIVLPRLSIVKQGSQTRDPRGRGTQASHGSSLNLYFSILDSLPLDKKPCSVLTHLFWTEYCFVEIFASQPFLT